MQGAAKDSRDYAQKQAKNFSQSSADYDQTFRSLAVQQAIEKGEVAFQKDKLTKKLYEFEDDSAKTAGPLIYSCFSPNLLLQAFTEFCDKDTISYDKPKDKYKLKFTKQGKDTFGNDFTLKCVLKIYEITDTEVAIQITKNLGDSKYFREHCKNWLDMMKDLKSLDDL